MKRIFALVLLMGIIPFAAYSNKTVSTIKGNIGVYSLEKQDCYSDSNKNVQCTWVLKIDSIKFNKIKGETLNLKAAVDSCKGKESFSREIRKDSKKVYDTDIFRIECGSEDQPKVVLYEGNEAIGSTDAIDNNVGDWSNSKKKVTGSEDQFIGEWVYEYTAPYQKDTYTLKISKSDGKLTGTYCAVFNFEAHSEGGINFGDSYQKNCTEITPEVNGDKLTFSCDMKDIGFADHSIQTFDFVLNKNKKILVSGGGDIYKKVQ